MIVVRSLSGLIVLVSSGYERESLTLMRPAFEALMRLHQVAADTGGHSARQILQGRKPGSLKSVAQRYGNKRENEILDRFAHADLLTLRVLNTTDGIAPLLELRPTRGTLIPGNQLHLAAHTAGETAAGVCEIFDVALQLPPWFSDQMIKLRDGPLPPGL
jgi:hypothetical protein